MADPRDRLDAAEAGYAEAKRAYYDAVHARGDAILYALDNGMGLRGVGKHLGISYQAVSERAAKARKRLLLSMRDSA